MLSNECILTSDESDTRLRIRVFLVPYEQISVTNHELDCSFQYYEKSSKSESLVFEFIQLNGGI